MYTTTHGLSVTPPWFPRTLPNHLSDCGADVRLMWTINIRTASGTISRVRACTRSATSPSFSHDPGREISTWRMVTRQLH
jgi:hypothetical protein